MMFLSSISGFSYRFQLGMKIHSSAMGDDYDITNTNIGFIHIFQPYFSGIGAIMWLQLWSR